MDISKQSIETSPDSVSAGIRAISPMLLGTAPFGIVFGAFALDMGLGIEGGQAMSLLVFAGSAQFVGANLFGQGASIVVIAVTTLFINLRHTLYGASLGPRLLNAKPSERILMSFFLTDESFAIVSQFKEVRARYYWGAALAMYFNWQVWTFVGLVSGSYLKGLVSLSLGFGMVPACIAIIVPQLKNAGSFICGISAVGISLIFSDLPNQIGLIIAATVAIIATLMFEYFMSSNRPDLDRDQE